MEPDQGRLLQRATAGDRDALAELLCQHAPAVRSRLAGSIPTRWQALLTLDDVLQQTYTDAALNIERYQPQPDASFSAWLLTIARRNLQDTIRLLAADKRGGSVRRVEYRDPNESYDGLLEMLAESTATPSRHAARKEIVAALERAIDALPEDHRRTVRMYDLEGRSVASIAKELGRTPGAVYMLRVRAHRWLREKLGRSSDFLG